MTLKDQLRTVKENWLIAAAFILLVLFVLFSGSNTSLQGMSKSYAVGMPEMDMMVESAVYRGGGGIYYDEDFAPETAERKITKSASLSSEVERGEFHEADTQLKAIVIATDSFLLNENVGENGVGRRSSMHGYYQIKVETDKYDAVISQLKKIGEVKHFSENAQDITGRFTDLTTDLEAEKSRLARYKSMYNSADDIEDKIQLTDRIFNSERMISCYEDALANIGKKVDYSTISVTLTEEQSGYANIVFVKFSELVRNFVSSVNTLISLIFVLAPYAIVALLAWFGYRKLKKK